MKPFDPDSYSGDFNSHLMEFRQREFDQIPGPRVGDFLRLPRLDPRVPEVDRFTHDWDDYVQTGGIGGSYYFGGTFCSYSGGLDPGVVKADLVATDETRDGTCWFFDEDIAGAGRGIEFVIPFRVFDLREGADLHGLRRCSTHYRLHYHEASAPAKHGNRWTLTYKGMNHRGFDHEDDIHAWLQEQRFRIAQPVTKTQEIL